MENEKKQLPESIPFVAHEAEVSRLYGIVKTMAGIIVLLILLLVGSNLGWMYYESQFETVTQTVEQEADNGTNNFVGGDLIGETESDNHSPQT